jgi:phosphoribosylformylglycinamidine synthase
VLKDKTEPVFPTPTIGMVGIVEDIRHATTLSFKSEGDVILVLGAHPANVNGSVYVKEVHHKALTPAPDFDIDEEFQLHEVITDLIRGSLVESAHDISEGGLFTSLLESAMLGNTGFEIQLPAHVRPDVYLFSEGQGRIVISVSLENFKTVSDKLDKLGFPFHRLGSVKPSSIDINGHSFGEVAEWKNLYDNSLTQILEQ